MKIKQISKKIGFVLISAFLVTGCKNAFLNQANKLSNNAQELQSVYENQANDYIESCYRRANHTLILTELGSESFAGRIEDRKACSDSDVAKAKDNFILQNKIISSYLIAIANLSKEENFTLFGADEETKLENLVNEFVPASNLGGIQPGQVFSTLVNFIFEAAAKDYAAEEIKTEVIRINPSFQKSVCYFKSTWQKIYERQLTFEEDKINSYYQNTINQVIQRDRLDFERNTLENENLRQELFQKDPDEGNLLTNYVGYPEVYEYDQGWQDELNALQGRRSALAQYINVLDKISAAHASLEEASGGKGQGQETFCKKSPSTQAQVKFKNIDAFLDEIGNDIKALKKLEAKNK